MKKLILISILALWVASLMAQTIVVDNEGEPMVGAIVIDNDGDPIGIVDDKGRLPNVAAELFPLTIRCIGYEPKQVNSLNDTLVMNPASRQLSEITVNPVDRPAMYVVCYVREVSGMTDGTDSITISTQAMVDYMLPAFKGAKCKTWNSPRVLSESLSVRTNNPHEISESDIKLMQWYQTFANLEKNGRTLPDSIRNLTSGTFEYTGKHGTERIIKLSPTNTTITIDALSDFENHVYTPGLFKLFGLTMDITERWGRWSYNYNPFGRYDASNLIAKSLSLNINGRGKGFKHIFPTGKTPINIYTYIEICPLEVSFLTKDEAKEMKKNKPEMPLRVPDFVK